MTTGSKNAVYNASGYNALRVGQKTAFLMEMQSLSGVAFDRDRALQLVENIDCRMKMYESYLRQYLPTVNVAKSHLPRFPSRPFRNGKGGPEPSALLIQWAEKAHLEIDCLEGAWVVKGVGPVQDIEPGFTIDQEKQIDLYSNSDLVQLKNHLIDVYGWNPSYWNIKVVGRKKEKTSPKFQSMGDLCPDLVRLGDNVKWIRAVVRWVQLKHRRSLLLGKSGGTGLCVDSRLDRDGRLSAGSGGLAHTRRQKHRGVVNIPRPGSFFGGRLRSLFKAYPGQVVVGFDASSLEAKIKAHYAYKHDDGEYAIKIDTPGYDEHAENAILWFPDDYAKDPKATRQRAKTGTYALQYNCMPPTLAKQLDCSVAEAEEYHRLYWQANSGWKSAMDEFTNDWHSRGKKFILCPVSGMMLQIRSEHSIGSTLIQHTGAFLMDYAGCLLDHWLGGIKFDKHGHPCHHYKGGVCSRVLYMHDELLLSCDTHIAQDVLEIGKRSIEVAGVHLQLNVNTYADGAIGKTWGDVH